MRYASGLILELNRLLLTLEAYGLPEGLSVPGIEDILKSTTFGARIPDHASTIALATDAGMIEGVGGRFRLTARGRAFARLNCDGSYELAPGQARFLAKAVFFDGVYRQAAARLFRNFRPAALQRTVVLSLAAVPHEDPEAASLLSMLRDCGVVEIRDGWYAITREYLPDVSRICARRPITQTELECLIQLRNAQGEAAEVWVHEFETRRLHSNECLLEAAAIQRISQHDIAAGYDIASFDGASRNLAHDRFIEVKSTSRPDPEFIWSGNEFETARHLRGRYWIYLLLSFGSTEQDLVAVQDPASEVESGRIELNPASYRATIRLELSRAI